jgi:hexokinase
MDKAEDLFEWIGDCIAEVIRDALDDVPSYAESPFGEELLLGVTFSFPMMYVEKEKEILVSPEC